MAFNFAAIIEDGQKNEKTSSDCSAAGQQLGLLTTANRRLWAQWRHQLLQGAVVNSPSVHPPLSLFFCCSFAPRLLSSFQPPQSKRKKKKRAVSLMFFGSGLTHVLSLLFFCTRFRRFNQRPLAAVHRVVVHDRLHRSAAARRSVQRRRGRRQRRHQPGPPNDSRRRHRMEHGEPLVR